ncbi:aspartate-semialdehyde dehydrogenase [bacterium]|nr:aspartate-semialdehyde dehydrogenase [bacterium]
MGLRLAIAGATGLVGQEMLDIIERAQPALESLGLFASQASVGQTFTVLGQRYKVEELADCDFSRFDAAFFCIGDDLSRQYVSRAMAAGCHLVDKSNAFRLAENVPLVVPEVNGSAIGDADKLIANPNCTTIVLSQALGPLSHAFGLRRVFAATYQSVSGAGRDSVVDLLETTNNLRLTAGDWRARQLDPAQLAYNVIARIGQFDETGRTGEEAKLVAETKKILAQPELPVVAHAVRVPVLAGHAIAVTVELDSDVEQPEIEQVWRQAPVVNYSAEVLPTPVGSCQHEMVEVGRLRREPEFANTWSFFTCGDNLRIAAALNGWRILELLAQRGIIPGLSRA